MKIYTDGSAIGNVCGYGCVAVDSLGFVDTNHGVKFHENASPFLAEGLAILEAIEWKNEHTILNLYTDHKHWVHYLTAEHEDQSVGDYLPLLRKIRAIWNKRKEEKKLTTIELTVETTKTSFYINSAHALSRKGYATVDEQFLNNEFLLPSKVAKPRINSVFRRTVEKQPVPHRFDVSVEKHGQIWKTVKRLSSFEKGDLLTESKQLTSALLVPFATKYQENNQETVVMHVHSELRILDILCKTKESETAPEDVKEKSTKLLHFIKKGLIVLT